MKRASRRKYHIIYRTTCTMTNRYYIGMHSTDDLADRYLGSGIRLRRSVEKYGATNHTREILEILSTRDEASEREKQIITEELRSDPLCLNCGAGGLGATDRPATREETRAKLSTSLKGKKRTEETRARMCIASKESQSRPDVRAKKSEAQRRTMNAPGMKEKLSLAQTKMNACPERRLKRSESRKEPCTVDGITIFESRTDLIKTLGKGKLGLRSPTFRYTSQRKRS